MKRKAKRCVLVGVVKTTLQSVLSKCRRKAPQPCAMCGDKCRGQLCADCSEVVNHNVAKRAAWGDYLIREAKGSKRK